MSLVSEAFLIKIIDEFGHSWPSTIQIYAELQGRMLMSSDISMETFENHLKQLSFDGKLGSMAKGNFTTWFLTKK